MKSRRRWAVVLLLGLAGLASLVRFLLTARAAAAEAGALATIRAILSAQAAYADANGGYFDTLDCLVKPAECIPGYRGPAFVDRGALTPGNDYRLAFHGGPAADPAPDERESVSKTSVRSFTVTAASEGDPQRRVFCGDGAGKLAYYTPATDRPFPKSVERGLRCVVAGEPGREVVEPPPLSAFAPGRLSATSVLATLDTPLPAERGRSAVWCAALDLAWGRARVDVLKGPLLLLGDPPGARRLNVSSTSEDDLAPSSVLALAGRSADVAERARREMALRFPQATPPSFPAGAFAAYAYLFVNVPFKLLYRENPKPLPFQDASGRSAPVHSFGLTENDRGVLADLREQARVLFANNDASEFAIDPDASSEPYQLVLARIERPASLAAGIERVAQLSKEARPLQDQDVLLVPNQHWEVRHRFPELEAPLRNRGFEGLPLQVEESLRFRLDRAGARLEAEAMIVALGGPDRGASYVFDRPFLLALRKRGAARPVFATWIANAELLDKAP